MALDELVLQASDVGILRCQLHRLHRALHSNDSIFALLEGDTVLGTGRVRRLNSIGEES